MAINGDIIFCVGQEEYLRLSSDGYIYVRGRIVGMDQDVVNGLKAWIKRVNCYEDKDVNNVLFRSGQGTSNIRGGDVRLIV